ncbi:DUF445 domain-containing protein [Aphanothece sacrum]|uniref:Uncharacterized protein n=1 Tax=Aphanothece sacrum FPU1 TaxID=1920663 RepID=A0A401II47_APHSA|nr:DUF445 family protein [Aphanothece sacrum]GBF80982.1 hypothetical protein AsFPU1_2391 [Aphanothece sacrum FPU1]GBF85289.1 hypothetical protein AsFPU3_2348 [Aphanothece sacrum FPU3]
MDFSSLDFALISTLVVPPIAGAIIGYFTNDIAINMLFRPYEAIYIGKQRLPFTPGLIPRNQERLAKKVSDTIMGSLLTPEELQKLARRLLKTERVQAAILWLLNLSMKQFKADKEQKTAKILADILRDLFSESLPRLIKTLTRRQDFLDNQINQIFDQILLDLRLSDIQARQFADWLLETVVPPEMLRQTLIDFLSERNIQVIDEGFREKTSGTYWVVANLFGLRNTLSRLRSFCIEEKEMANTRLKELLLSLEIRSRLRQGLLSLSLQNLPVSTVRELRTTIRETVKIYIQESGPQWIEDLGRTIEWEQLSVLIVNRLQASTAVITSLETISQELALVLEKYLEEDLEKIVSQAIPILSIDQVIIDRVNATSPQNLELAIQGIVKSELQAIVNLGGVLGFMVGILQTIFFLLR